MQQDHQTNNFGSMFESILHKIQMNLYDDNFIQDASIQKCDVLSFKSNSIKSLKQIPRKWIFEQDLQEQPIIEKMINNLSLKEREQLNRIQTSRIDQESKIEMFLNSFKPKVLQDSETSREKHLKNNLNLSPRKKKKINKQINKLPKFKLQF